MLITVSGVPGTGKTTAARILRLALPGTIVVPGDNYVEKDSDRISVLRNDLDCALASGALVVLEHVSAFNLAMAAGHRPSLSIFLRPSDPHVKRDWVEIHYGDYSHFLISQLNAQQREETKVRQANVDLAVVENVGQVVAAIIRKIDEDGGSSRIATFVLKVAAGCNLACSYCYMYEAHDTKWKSLPWAMSEVIIGKAAERIIEYREAGAEQEISVVLHGGEPLALPREHLKRLVHAARTHFPPDEGFHLGLQTNGTLLDESMLKFLDDSGVRIGLSLDGGSVEANSRRPFLSGKSSLNKAVNGLRLLVSHDYRHGGFGGVLSVLGGAGDAEEFYSFVKRESIQSLDLLMLGKTSRTEKTPRDFEGTLEFLTETFDIWMGDEEPPRIRLFESIIARLFKKNWQIDALGFGPASLLGVGTDGSWELLDSLRLAYEGAWETGMNVTDSSVSEVLRSDSIHQFHSDTYNYSNSCLACSVFEVCGAGYLPHRYTRKNRFKNPSSNCSVLYGLISHVRHRLGQQLAARTEPSGVH